MTIQDQVDALLEQASALKAAAAKEGPFLKAKAAYHERQTPKTAEAYRRAAVEFQQARAKARSLAVVSTSPGSATIVPGTVRKG